MDPQVTFNNFIKACVESSYGDAMDAAEYYNEWVKKGGYMVEDGAGDKVQRLDASHYRYLALVEGDIGGRWRNVE